MLGTQRRFREAAAVGFEWGALTFAGAAVASPILLAGGVSAAAQGVFILSTAVALLLSVVSMVVSGEFRILRSFLWAPLLAVLTVGFLQLVPAAGRCIPKAAPDWLAEDAAPAYAVTLNRGETVQVLAWLTAAAVLVFVLAAHVRTMTRLCTVVGLFATVLAGAGMAGPLETVLEAPTAPRAQLALEPGLAAWLGEIYFTPALTCAAPRVPQNVASAAGENFTFFVSQTPNRPLFSEWDDGAWWAASVALVFPLALSVCVHLAASGPLGGFPTRGRSKLAFVLWCGVVVMAAVASWRSDPLIAGLAATVSCSSLVWFIGEEDRSTALRWCGGAWLVVAAAVAARFALLGPEEIAGRFRAWTDDSVAAARVVSDLPWLGCGLGAFRDVWFAYQPHPEADASRVNGVMTLAAQMGVVGALFVGVSFTYGFVRAFWVRPELGSEARIALAGGLGGAGVIFVLALCGGGIAAAPTLAIGAFVVATAARGAADGFPREAPTPA
jgi:hypothetical protein